MKTIKLLFTAILATVIIMTVGCRKNPYDGPNAFILNVEEMQLDGDTLFLGEFNGDRRLISIDVNLEVAASHWEIITPTVDDWIAFSRDGDRIRLTVGDNRTNQPRWSWFEFSIGENTRRIHVHQDYVRWIEFAVGDTFNVGAPSGRASLEVVTNVAWENIELTFINHETTNWVNEDSIIFSLEDGRLRFEYEDNLSLDNMRHFSIILSGEGTSGRLTLSQNQLSGEPYVIDISGVTFEDSYVYEIWDPINNVLVGKLALEYLHKQMPGSPNPIVRMRTIVVYPMTTDGSRVNLANGLVVETGRHITWNSNVTVFTAPHDILAIYEAGEQIDPSTPMITITLRETPHEITLPSTVYLARGASRMNISGLGVLELPEGDRIHAEVRPFVLRDVRTGPPNNHGETHEDITYGVVKIGTQFWTRENLRTTRWSDNNQNIPTGDDMLERGRWGDPDGLGPWTPADGNPLIGPGAEIGWANGMFPAVQIAIREHSQPPNSVTTRSGDANNQHPDTAAIRDRYGLIYNFHAMTRTRGIFNQQIPAEQIVDRLSPQGTPWHVPTLNEFRILARYTYQTTLLPPLPPQGTWGKLSGYTLEAYPNADPFRRGHASNVTGFTGIGNVSRSNTPAGTNGGTMFLVIDGYRWRPARDIAFQQHWMDFFSIETQQTAEAGHNPSIRAGQATHRGKYVRLILDPDNFGQRRAQ